MKNIYLHKVEAYDSFSIGITNKDIYDYYQSFYQQKYAHYKIMESSLELKTAKELLSYLNEEFYKLSNFVKDETVLESKIITETFMVFIVFNRNKAK